MVTASQLLAAPSASDRSSAASIPADRTSNLSSTPSRSSRLSVTRASVASNVKRASTTARMTLLDTARSSLLYAVSALGWAILMCLPSLALIGARYPLLNAWGWSLIKHDPLLEHPPNPEYHLGGAPASAADIPSEHFTLGWLAHLEEGVEVNTQLLAALMFVVLHVTLTHAKAAEQEFRSVRKLVLMSAAPLMVTQMVGRVLSFSSPMLATALIWLPAWFVLVMVGRRCSEPLGCNNFFWCLSFEHAGFWLLGICYMYVLVPLVMVSQPGRQVVYLVIALPVIKTAATMTSRFGGFCATGLPAEHKMVFGLIVPCVSGFTGRMLIATVPSRTARGITVLLTAATAVLMRVQESVREKNIGKYKIAIRSWLERHTAKHQAARAAKRGLKPPKQQLPGSPATLPTLVMSSAKVADVESAPTAGAPAGAGSAEAVDGASTPTADSAGAQIALPEPAAPDATAAKPKPAPNPKLMVHQFFMVESECEIANIILATVAMYLYRIGHSPEQVADTSVPLLLLELFLTLSIEVGVDAVNASWMYFYEGFRFEHKHLDTSHRITITAFIMIGVTVMARFTSPYTVWSAQGIKPVVYQGELYWQWAYE